MQNDKNFNQLFIELAPAEFRGFMIITTDSTNLWEGGFKKKHSKKYIIYWYCLYADIIMYIFYPYNISAYDIKHHLI